MVSSINNTYSTYYTETKVNFIRIVMLDSETISETMDKDPNYETTLHASSTRIQDLPIPAADEVNEHGDIQNSYEYNAAFSNIVKHYVTPEEYDAINYVGVAVSNSFYSSNGEIFIDAVYLGSGYIKLKDDMTVANFEVSLGHEVDHIVDHPNCGGLFDDSPEQLLEHAKMFIHDTEHDSWDETTEAFKRNKISDLENTINSFGMAITRNEDTLSDEDVEYYWDEYHKAKEDLEAIKKESGLYEDSESEGN
ncbi:MAG: hypothetical protein MK105_02290 [Crocinitomicaceae bacterium]|nr:hypothetical protein [Crocinitomicaceae bacterium]